MEAAKLKKKKGTLNKGKLKKTIKNIICRPDPVFWPTVTDAEENLLTSVLIKYRINIPDLKKPHWNQLKLMPKNERPKFKPIQKIEGFLFGMSVCRDAIENNDCSAILVEALVEPRIIVQSIIEACTFSDIPVICLKNLKILTKNNFGIQTSCLGIKKECLLEISKIVKEIYQKYKPKLKQLPKNNSESVSLVSKQSLQKEDSQTVMDIANEPSRNPYLFRTNKKTRVFVPLDNTVSEKSSKFVGQHFIKLPAEQNENKVDSKNYMQMILKKISNNPNRKRKVNELLE
ncbi:unnamed protein product [Euphydryas editha]|uniref:Ribosomal protein L7Ae/L30e/S12e/Gadd45 domain-containing protein n=1 Tax=Euphydryas editha TaxID=104508 RepID=A0AAU9U1G6_EUPED|nr:unnamed protein product [Euphydryas editha]